MPHEHKRARTEATAERALHASDTPDQTGSVTTAPPSDRSAPEQLLLVTWNLAGYRSASRSLLKYLSATDPDIVCLQETKLQITDVPGPFLLPRYPYKTWFCSTARKGYSGTAVLSKLKPERVHKGIPGHREHDAEGRCIVYEFADFTLVTVYVPNSGVHTLNRLRYRIDSWDAALREYLCTLRRGGICTILCGDVNVALDDTDVYSAEACRGHSGFTDEERHSWRRTLNDAQLVDAFRVLHPSTQEPRFTFWDYRTSVGGVRRDGWRIDVFCVSPGMLEHAPSDGASAVSRWRVRSVRSRPDIFGSDHCPVELTLARNRRKEQEQAEG